METWVTSNKKNLEVFWCGVKVSKVGTGLGLKGLLYSLTTLENYSFLLSVGSSEPSLLLHLSTVSWQSHVR